MREGFDYLLVYDRERGKPRLSLRASREGRKLAPTIVKVTGKPAEEGYAALKSSLSKCGGLRLIERGSSAEKYGLRPDLAPVAGAFILLLRRSRNPSKWEGALAEALRGGKPLIGEALSEFFLMALSLSSSLRGGGERAGLPPLVLPKVAEALSSAMRRFIEAIRREGK